MLSRHFLRSKVLQMLYANTMEPQGELGAMAAFDKNIVRLNELGIIQVALLPAIVHTAEQVFEDGKKKFRPTEAELEPNVKLLGNEFIRRMDDNFDLKKRTGEWALMWSMHDELLREIFAELRKQQFYTDYIAQEVSTFEQDKEMAVALFKFLMTRESLVAVIEERSLLWEDDFYQIAQYNYMMLKTLDEVLFDEAMAWPLMYDKRVEKDVEAMDFARTLLSASIKLQDESTELIKKYLQGWEFERVSQMDILLVDMAVAELQSCPTIPEKVTMDEYIELSKEFSSERSKLFINGILDKIIIELRSKGKINKTGRGLLTFDDLDIQITI